MNKFYLLVACIVVLANTLAAASRIPMDIEDDDSDAELYRVAPLSDHMIKFINEKANTTWRAARTKFHDWSMEAVKRLMGVPSWHMNKITKHLPVMFHEAQLTLEDRFDSREQWPDCPTLKEIRDQGNCGSCWAISAVETMSDRICIASGGKANKHLSTEDLVSCCHTCGFGCNGGYPNMAWEHFKKSGICTGGNYNTNEGCKPYSIAECEHHSNGTRPPCQGESHTPHCTKTCTNSDYTVKYDNDKSKGQSVYTIKSEEQIQTEIAKNGPVQTAFSVYEDFLSYKSGVYQHKTGSEVGGHAVKIVGWGVDGDVPYWLVANSWNTDWAEDGFFRILRGSNECGIEENVVAGSPNFA